MSKKEKTTKLEDIGFRTLSDNRCKMLRSDSPMRRCELILTDRCNFQCPYCRGLRQKGTMEFHKAQDVLDYWCEDGLESIRFSGGEPLLHPQLNEIVCYAKQKGVEHIAISSNGSFPIVEYLTLVTKGVNDFSISLDACCSTFGEKMSGVSDQWEHVVSVVRELSEHTYVTVGIVLTEINQSQGIDTIQFAHNLGVADIRIIPAAQNGNTIKGLEKISCEILESHPILAYRVKNSLRGISVRGIQEYDSHRCYIPIDDSVISSNYHFPCVIYMREGGEPIGQVNSNMRTSRVLWSEKHNTFEDPICQKNCLDVCVAHNNKCASFRSTGHPYPLPFRGAR